jgi:hypothetical protein
MPSYSLCTVATIIAHKRGPQLCKASALESFHGRESVALRGSITFRNVNDDFFEKFWFRECSTLNVVLHQGRERVGEAAY